MPIATILAADHWTALIEAMRSGAVNRLYFRSVDFSALDDDALSVVLGIRGLQSLDVRASILPSGFLIDSLIRSIATKGLLELCFVENNSDALNRLTEDAVRTSSSCGRDSRTKTA